MAKFLVAFDINGTLLRKLHKNNECVKPLASRGIRHDFRYKQYFVYVRPHLDMLVKFIESHDTNYVLWTTARTDNARYLTRYLECLGLDKGIRHYSQADCKVGKVKIESDADLWVKDLRIVSENHSVDLKNCVLVDDSVDKSIHDQNFICCPQFMPGEDDTGIIQICRHLDKFFGCREECIAKRPGGGI